MIARSEPYSPIERIDDSVIAEETTIYGFILCFNLELQYFFSFTPFLLLFSGNSCSVNYLYVNYLFVNYLSVNYLIVYSDKSVILLSSGNLLT